MTFLKLLYFDAVHGFLAAFAQSCTDSQSRTGTCIALSKCPHIIEEFYNLSKSTPNVVDFQTFISDSICGFDGIHFLICCYARGVQPEPIYAVGTVKDLQSQSLTVQQRPVQEFFTFASLGGNPSTSLPPTVFAPVPSLQPNVYAPVPQPLQQPQQPTGAASSGCGISGVTTNRVVGGTEAKRGSYPWIAALGYFDEYNRNTVKFLCGGSLVSSMHVVTSAHCINSQLTLVRLGAHDLMKPLEPGAMDFRIKRTVVHEFFNLQSIVNDIAVIELQTPTPNTNSIRPICLPESSYFLTQDFVGMNPFVAGWGAKQHQGTTSSVLLEAQVPIVNRATCEQSYRSVFQFVEFSDKLICAGSSNVDACQGDSGGPLMMPQLEGNIHRFYLLGIVSYGYECARSGFPGVYTRVASYTPWLRGKF